MEIRKIEIIVDDKNYEITLQTNLEPEEIIAKLHTALMNGNQVEAQVSQENGEHPLHTFRAKDGRFKYTSLASRKIHNDIVYTLANRLEQFISEHIRTETQ